jgi:hypothetical protein
MAEDRAWAAGTALEADFRGKDQVRDATVQGVDRAPTHTAESLLILVPEERAVERAERLLCREFPCKAELRR